MHKLIRGTMHKMLSTRYDKQFAMGTRLLERTSANGVEIFVLVRAKILVRAHRVISESVPCIQLQGLVMGRKKRRPPKGRPAVYYC